MSGDPQSLPETPRGEITKQLLAWSAGDNQAASSAFAALYATLRRLAGHALAGERPDHTLGTAGLISESFFRLMEQQHIEWRSREHFIATAAQMMRRILIDHARSRATAKRGYAVPALPLVDAGLVSGEALDGLVAIHDAVEALAVADRLQSQIIELRFFGGMTHEEIARYLGMSLATVERRWRLARAWLYRHLKGTVG
jgi:RNA polymerase sigma factor (TIGR02999 family)